MPEIVIVRAVLGGSIVADGTYPCLMVAGPADGAVLDLPAWGTYTPSRISLTVDGRPAAYFSVTGPRRPGKPHVYVWDDPDDPSIPHELQVRIGEALRA